MAKKKTLRPKGKQAGSRSRRAMSSTGPMTLEQARAMVRAQAPKRAPRRSLVASASPESVGIERKKLALKYRQENKSRIKEYKATLAILKSRGVKGLATKPEIKIKPSTAGSKVRRRRRAPSADAKSGQPLQIVAEGDSWFDYPVFFSGGGIIPRLESRLGVPILNLAKAGDEVRYMLGVEERKLLIEQFTTGCPAGGPWDAMLFSGGGNDIVDNPMALWIRDFDPAIPLADHIHTARFNAALALVRAGYEDLISLRDDLSPTTQLFFHAYDFAIPDGRGVCFMGPWLKPTFDLRSFPSKKAAFEVVKAMLQKFAAMLQSLVRPNNGVSFLNLQGTLEPVTSSWDNELHPSRSGFDKFADAFHQAIEEKFPNRVL